MSEIHIDKNGMCTIDFEFPIGEYGPVINVPVTYQPAVKQITFHINDIDVWESMTKLQVNITKDIFKDEYIKITAQIYRDSNNRLMSSQVILNKSQTNL